MFINALEAFFDYTVRFFKVLRMSDVIDIVVVAILIYYCIMALRGTRAVQLLRGIFIAAVVYMLSSILHLDTLNYILSAVFQVAMVAIVVIFQPELRNILEKIGRLKFAHFLGLSLGTDDGADMETVINSISDAAADMSEQRTGALIVIERGTRLGEYMNSGTVLNANVTAELLKNIFVPKTPLHDGAVILRGGKIINAGCVLPLTANANLSTEMGTRHRAALGVSEASDAVVVVVSEETGVISIAMNGSLMRNLSKASLHKALTKLLSVESETGADALKRVKLRKSK